MLVFDAELVVYFVHFSTQVRIKQGGHKSANARYVKLK